MDTEWMRHIDLDNCVRFDARELTGDDERELLGGELPWGRGYTARAVAEARLNDPHARALWEWRASSSDVDFASMIADLERELQVEYDPMRNEISVVRRSERKQNQSFDTTKLDEFLSLI